MLTFIFAAVGAILWALIIFGVLYIRQSPSAQVRRKIYDMITAEEARRAALEKKKKDDKPKVEESEEEKKTFHHRVMVPLFDKAEKFLRRFTPTYIVALIENRIFRAGKGNEWSVQKFSAAWALFVAVGLFVGFRYATSGDYFVTQQILITLAGGAGGAFLPFMILNSTIKKRQKMLKKQLPEFLDLLCVSVQAGLSFDSAVAKITTRMKGALADEFRHMQDDIKFGMTKQYALAQLAKRCDVEEIYLFTTSIVQAEKLGTSMSQTLTLQSDNMRERHRQFVKAEALKAPIKMLFPMVIFIFPSIFVVLLMPSVISITKSFGN